MNKLPSTENDSQITSSIHLEFIRIMVDADSGEGATEVAEFHRAIFLNQFGRDIEKHQQEQKISEDRLKLLEFRQKRVNEKLADQDKLVPVIEDEKSDTEPKSPWTCPPYSD